MGSTTKVELTTVADCQSSLHCIISLSVAALRRRAGGSIFVRTGNHGNGVDRMVPEMRHMEECSWASTWLTCVERCHGGQQYSATETAQMISRY